MSIKLLVRQGGGAAAQPDIANLGGREGAPIFDDKQPLIEMGHRWEQGTASRGFFTSLDPDALLTYKFRPHASVKLIEDDSGSDVILAWGRIEGGNDVGRESHYTAADAVKHISVQTMDANLDLRGLPFKNGWSRPAEDSWERLQALHLASLNGSSSTEPIRRSTTSITVDRFSNGHLVDATAPVDLDAVDYPAGTHVEEVLTDIMGQWGMGWGITIHHTGGSHKCLLVQAYDDLAKFTSALKISDQVADWLPTHATAPVLEPIWRRAAGKTSDNSSTISGLISVYGGTNDDPRHLFVETGEAPEDWEIWVDTFNDDLAENETQAERRAENILEDRKRPYTTNQPSILLLPEQVTLITAGQAIEVKSVVMNQGPDKHTYVWRRIAEVRWEPNYDGRWWAHLELDRPRNSRPASGGGQPASTSPKPAPECPPADPGGIGDPVAGLDLFCEAPQGVSDACGPWSDEVCWLGSAESFTSYSDIAVGTYYSEVQIATKYGGLGPWVFRVQIRDTVTSNPNLSVTLDSVSMAQCRAGQDWTTTSGTFEVPAGYNQVRFGLLGPGGKAALEDSHVVNEYTPPGGGGGDEFCIDYGDSPNDSPYYLPSDYVEDRLDELQDQISNISSAEPVDIGDLLTSYPFVISAHRGDIGSADSYPENTRESVLQAAVKGARMVEMDVQRSSDGTWHLMHDTTVNRTTSGTGTLSAMTDAAIAALDIDGGYGYNAGRHGTTLNVPTLESVLNTIKQLDVTINLDNKDTGGDAGATALAEFVVDQGWLGRTAIHNYTLTAPEAIKAVSERIHNSISTNVEADPVNNPDVDEVIERETEWTSRADVYQFAPKYAASFIHPDFDFGVDETSRLEAMFGYGIRFYHTLDLDTALTVRSQLLAGLTATSVEAAGRWEVVVSGSAPPVAVTNAAQDDWIHEFIAT